MATELTEVQRRLWKVADELRANSGLQASEYTAPILGLIFLAFGERPFASDNERRTLGYEARVQAEVACTGHPTFRLPEEARLDHLMALPAGADVGRAIDAAMVLIEEHNPSLEGALPKSYSTMTSDVLLELLHTLRSVSWIVEGDGFGLVYEYFLGQFAMAEGRGGGEFFTPTSIVKLLVEVVEPYHGKILDPACGSGGMFVQSATFVDRHQTGPDRGLSVFGQEKSRTTVRLAKMNLAVHGLTGNIACGNFYYEDLHDSLGAFDFVLANPPFNVDKVDMARLTGDPRFRFGLPASSNANFLWIQGFYSALNETGRAGFVMANSACDSGGSELEIRRRLVEDRAIDVLVAVGTNMFLTLSLPVTLWFLDKGKRDCPRADEVLFIDARDIYTTIDRSHREWSVQQVELLANITRLWRGHEPEFNEGTENLLLDLFPGGTYENRPGFCGTATIEEIARQNYSLNPGRYVGYEVDLGSDQDFDAQLASLTVEFEMLSNQTVKLTDEVISSLRDGDL